MSITLHNSLLIFNYLNVHHNKIRKHSLIRFWYSDPCFPLTKHKMKKNYTEYHSTLHYTIYLIISITILHRSKFFIKSLSYDPTLPN